MLERLGHVLGWTGIIVAIPIFIFGLYLMRLDAPAPLVGCIFVLIALIIFLIGRALRYIFAG